MNKALFDDDDENDKAPPKAGRKQEREREPAQVVYFKKYKAKAPAMLGGRRRVCDSVEDYLAEYKEKSSIRNKKFAACKTLLDLFETKGIFFVDEITRKAMSDHRNSLSQNFSVQTGMTLGEGTQRDYTVIMRHLIKNMLDNDGLTPDVYYSYKLSRLVKPSIYVATDSESLIVLGAGDQFWDEARNPGIKYIRPSLRRFHRARFRVILSLAISLGLRIGETCNICVQDYNRELRQITLPKTKSGKERIVPVSATLAAEIEAWLRARPKKATTPYLLLNEEGEKLQAQAVTRLYRRYLAFVRAQGIELPNITMHSHRHKALTAIVKVNPRHAQLVAGHGSITTTINNYDHQVAEDVRESYEQADALKRVMSQVQPARKPRGRKVA